MNNNNKTRNELRDFTTTKQVRVINATIFCLFLFFGYVFFSVFTILFSYLNILISILFLILEIRYVVLTKSNFLKHIFSNWLVIVGFSSVIYNIVSLFFLNK